ncbi:MAG: hypothetical protein KA388_09435 [Rhodocyclaceae bacterium]|nr:hypothetical protein [Rhodocyclaceae bacterium]MBP6279969.1 hypothetical protein [Rhodocyclaceae bacterium]
MTLNKSYTIRFGFRTIVSIDSVAQGVGLATLGNNKQRQAFFEHGIFNGIGKVRHE